MPLARDTVSRRVKLLLDMGVLKEAHKGYIQIGAHGEDYRTYRDYLDDLLGEMHENFDDLPLLAAGGKPAWAYVDDEGPRLRGLSELVLGAGLTREDLAPDPWPPKEA
jgi:hypothetical protein